LKKDGYNHKHADAERSDRKKRQIAEELSLLHIATHGYFMSDVAPDDGGSMFGISSEMQTIPVRSVSSWAGAGQAIKGKEQPELGSNDNGILTAYEAMNLNLEERTCYPQCL